LIVDVLELVLAELDDVVRLQKMFLDRLPVHQRAVGRAEILEERVVEDGHDDGMLAGHGQVVDLDVVVRFAPDGGALFGQGDFLEHQPIHTENQFCRHDSVPIA
jgi:hypothetical protein